MKFNTAIRTSVTCFWAFLFLVLLHFSPAGAVWLLGLTALGFMLAWLGGRISLLTMTIISALVVAPVTRAEEPPPKQESLIVGCMVVAIGGVVIYGIYKLASLIPPVTNTPPVVVIPPPTTGTKTNGTNIAKLSLNAMNHGQSADIGDKNIADPFTSGAKFVFMSSFTVEASEDLVNWHPSLCVTSYLGSAGQYMEFWSNGVRITSTYTHGTGTNYPDMGDMWTFKEKAMFLRMGK